MGNDRYVGLCGVGGTRVEYVLGRGKYVDVVDLRKPGQAVMSTRHFCEEAPPSVLITETVDSRKVLIAYSPTTLGSSLLFNLTPNSKKLDI